MSNYFCINGINKFILFILPLPAFVKIILLKTIDSEKKYFSLREIGDFKRL